MIIMFGVRTVWVAILMLFFYFFVALKRKMIVFSLCLAPVFIVVSALIFHTDSYVFKSNVYVERAITKAKSTAVFVSEQIKQSKSNGVVEEIPSSLEKDRQLKTGFANIVWRKKVWGGAIAFGVESPVFGKGFGVYPQYDIWGYRPPIGIGVDSKVVPVHNHLITIFYKMGIVGLGLYLFLNGYVFIYGLRNIRKCEDRFMKCFLTGALGAFVYWHTMALAFDVIDSPPTSIFLWIIMGLVLASVQNEPAIV